MSKFSVKKPYTIFVAVVAIIVLGIVSYTKMTPDLMPNMNLPYVLVITTYPGATPEKVELEVSRPLEQSFATLDKIKNVVSTSSENYSMIALEFEDDVNMDTISIDILQDVEAVSGSWDDMVGTPYILKINPSMLPVAVTAVGMEGMDTQELSNFMKDEIIPKLEGVEGVASIDSSGLIETKIHVVLNQDKIDAVNEKISAALDDKFADAKSELDDGQAEINSGKSKINKGKSELNAGKESMAEETANASAKLTSGSSQLLEVKIPLQEKKKELEETKKDLEEKKKTLTELSNSIKQAESAKAELENAKAQLTSGISGLKEAKTAVDNMPAVVESQVRPQVEAAILNQMKAAYGIAEDAEIPPELLATIQASAEYQAAYAAAYQPAYDQAMETAYVQIDAQLAAAGTNREGLDATIATLEGQLSQVEASLVQVNSGLDQIDQALSAQGMQRSDVQNALTELDNGLAQINAGLEQINNGLAQIDNGSMQLLEGQKLLEQQKTLGILQLSEATTQLLVGEFQLTSAQAQLDAGLDQFEEAKEKAYEQADLDNIITMDMISQILFAQNFAMPAGYIEEDGIQYMVSVGDEIVDEDEINNLLLMDMHMDGLDPIYLSDVADVFLSDNSSDVYANIDGTNGIMLSFTKQSTYATAEVADNITKRLDKLTEEYEGFHYSTMMDQGDYIYMIINAILKSLLLGALFAIIILFLFLKDIRPTFITLCSIPISVIFAFVLMYFSGITLNMISMSGLAIAVGMLVDNSVVVIENTYRLIAKGESAIKAAVAGASQVAGAVIASTLTTICVFLPIVFVDGLTRELFTDLALTMGYALIASLIISLTLVPAMASRVLKNTKEKSQPIMDRLLGGYRKLIAIALNHKLITLSIALGLLVFSFVAAIAKGFIFMPNMSSNQMSATITVSEEDSFADLVEASDHIVEEVLKMDGVESVGAMAQSEGSTLSMMGGGSSDGPSTTLYVMLKEDGDIDTYALADQINALGEKYDCIVDAQADGGMGSMMSMLGGEGITLYLYGDDMDTLQESAKEVAKIMEGVKGTIDVSDGLEDTSPAIKITVDKEKAMKEGLTVAQIYQELAGAIKTESTATSITMDADSYDVLVQKDDEKKLSLSELKKYEFETTDQEGEKKTVKLKDIAEIKESESLQTINRHNQKRYLSLSCGIEEGYNVTLVTADVKEALDQYELPAGMSIEYNGQNEEIMEAMKQFVLMILLGIVLVYLVMVAQFQSLKSPFIILFTIPLAFTGGFLSLLICGMDVSVISMMGFVMLTGIIVNNGIVLVDFINQLRAEGMEKREAVIEAGVTRMRPILMTTLTTILGLFDMALAKEMGSEMMQPVAVVCIGGLLYATLMTLFVVPCLYDLLNRKDMKVIKDEDLILETE